METMTLQFLLDVLSRFGLGGAIVVIWYFDGKRIDKIQAQHRMDVTDILAQYQRDMVEMRKMYENNVGLVKAYENVASDLHDVVIMNTRAFSHLADDIEKNQFCPNVRLTKLSPGEIR